MSKPTHETITLELFTEAIEKMKKASDIDDAIDKAVRQNCNDNLVISLSSYLSEVLQKVLEETMKDSDRILDWWLWDLEYGKCFSKGDWDIDGKPVRLYTIEELYLYLCGSPVFEEEQ